MLDILPELWQDRPTLYSGSAVKDTSRALPRGSVAVERGIPERALSEVCRLKAKC